MKRGYVLKKKDLKNIKEFDYFQFNYKPEFRRYMSDHCFDGRLRATNTDSGIILLDSYWNYNGGVHFTIEDAFKKGALVFYCNLREVVRAANDCCLYYDDNDVFNLSSQHGCYVEYAIKKEATRSKDKILSSLYEEKRNLKRKIESLILSLELLAKYQERVENGRLDITI